MPQKGTSGRCALPVDRERRTDRTEAAWNITGGVIKMSDLFSMAGRYSRSKYLWMTLGVSMITYALSFLIGIMMGMTGGGENAASIVGGALGLVSSIICAFIAVKRLHDLDRPGAHFWLLLVPLYNIYLSFVLLFTKGTAGSNRFGADPVSS